MISSGPAAKLARAATVAILAAGSLSAQTPSTAAVTVDVQKLGPQVGAKVPDFKLNDQQGQPRTLRSVMGPKGVLLVFFRSADW
jgi:cytochrome oxidase Cu insertion factor (SCO1/SenC/PrrC family)